MKKVIFGFFLIAACLLATTACDEQKTIDAMKTGESVAYPVMVSLHTALGVIHVAGKISEETWAKIEKGWATYEAARKMFVDLVATWEAGVNKPTFERIMIAFQNLNLLAADFKAIVDTLKLPTQ